MKNKLLKNKTDNVLLILKLLIYALIFLPYLCSVIYSAIVGGRFAFYFALFPLPFIIAVLIFFVSALDFVRFIVLPKNNRIISVLRCVRGCSSILSIVGVVIITIINNNLPHPPYKSGVVDMDLVYLFLLILAAVLFVLSIAEFTVILFERRKENKYKKQ